MQTNWIQLESDVRQNRHEIIERLINFSTYDVLLFWSGDEQVCQLQQKKWTPIIKWVNDLIKACFVTTEGLESPKANQVTAQELKSVLEGFSDKQLAVFYSTALNMRSVLLALALVKGRIDAAEAFELAELEELYQAEKWGSEPQAEARRNSIKQQLVEAESYLHS